MSERTAFGGLEVLAPGEPLSADGYRFQAVNPKITDRLLQLGAVSHKHDAHAAVAAPGEAPVVTTAAEGGTIPAATTLHVAYTWVDEEGGETMASPPGVVTTAAGLESPLGAPTAVVDYTAGALLAGGYDYAITVTDGVGGETEIGPAESIVVEPGHANARVKVSGLKALREAVGGTTHRLWRRFNGGPWYLIEEGAGNEVVDDGALPGDCTVQPPATTTAHGANKITVTTPGGHPARAASFNLYVSQSGSFPSPCFVANYPLASLGAPISLTSLAPLDGAPPPVSLSVPGANKIDPDTDMIEWRWKRPVKKASELPAEKNEEGDTRLSIEDAHLHVWTGAAWVDITAKAILTTHDFVLRGGVTLEPAIPGHTVGLAAGQVQHLVAVRYKILTGASLSFRIQKNGADIPGFGTAGEPLVAKPEVAEAKPGEAALLANHDEITPLLSASAGEPTGGKITLVIAHLF